MSAPGDKAPGDKTPETDAPETQGQAPAAAPEKGERIAKWIARAGVVSRRDAEKLIERGPA